MNFDRSIFNIILIHVARVWERVRLTQPHEEMKLDNIGSTDAIEAIATSINQDTIIQEFLSERDGSIWSLKTKYGASDVYIESLAEEIIKKDYIIHPHFSL